MGTFLVMVVGICWFLGGYFTGLRQGERKRDKVLSAWTKSLEKAPWIGP